MSSETPEKNRIENSVEAPEIPENSEHDQELFEIFVFLSEPPYLERLIEFCNSDDFLKKAKEYSSRSTP